MKKITHEFRNYGRCSTKTFEDVEIARIFFENKFINPTEEIFIKGFIQEIRLHKFGYLMYSQNQVKISNTKINFYSLKPIRKV